jgi:GntR family transcriptional regulator / MocR family aminotransferase
MLNMKIDLNTPPARYREIYERIRRSIAEGRLRTGDRLPPARTLAEELNIARGTVDTAYAALAGEGLVVSRGRVGTFVSPTLPDFEDFRCAPGSELGSPAEDPEDFRYLFEFPKPLMPGLPSFDKFPRKLWSQTVARHVRQGGTAHLTYPDPLGLPELRQVVASHIAVARGIRCDPERVIITAGYLGALSLVCQAALDTASQAWIEAPGYNFTRRAIQMAGATPVPILVDDEGLNVAEGIRVAPRAALCVVTPSNQFPLGVSLSLQRRVALLKWATQSGGWIVEDDYTGELRYDGWPLPALKSIDNADRVFFIGSFSKTMFPGLRIGYLVAPKSQFTRVRDVARRLNGGRSILEQAALAEFIAKGDFGRHIKRMRTLYAGRKNAMTSAITTTFGSRFQARPLTGGLHLVVHLADSENDVDIEDAAGRAGLRPLALSKMSQGSRPMKGLLLGFANAPQGHTQAVIRQLERAIQR